MPKLIVPQFKDVKFMSAREKESVFKAWVRFVRNGFRAEDFTNRLYKHLSLHCSFIAHYNQGGFYAVYFTDPQQTLRFLSQFDREKGCVSVEYGMTYWIRGGNDVTGEYYDLNNAMVDAIAGDLPEIYQRLSTDRLAKAKAVAAAAQAEVARLEGQVA